MSSVAAPGPAAVPPVHVSTGVLPPTPARGASPPDIVVSIGSIGGTPPPKTYLVAPDTLNQLLYSVSGAGSATDVSFHPDWGDVVQKSGGVELTDKAVVSGAVAASLPHASTATEVRLAPKAAARVDLSA